MTSSRFAVVHRTEYRYGSVMNDGYTVAHLLPRDTPLQRVESAEVHVTPDPDEYDEHIDAFGNRGARLGVHHPHDCLGVTARSVVEVLAPPTFDELAVTSPSWSDVATAIPLLRGDQAVAVGAFAALTPPTSPTDGISDLVADAFVPGRSVVEAARRLCSRIFHDFEFDAGFSDVSTPLGAVVAARRGVCQDFAHLSLACLRSVGLAARYVSGYIETEPPPGVPKLAGADASHAWCSVWSPAGWVDFDPTNDQFPARQHVTVAWGRDYFDVAPVHGVVIGPATSQALHVGVDVTRLAARTSDFR